MVALFLLTMMTSMEVLPHIVIPTTANLIAGKALRMVTMDMLPVNILFGIFDMYRLDALEHSPLGGRLWEWYTLAQVCQRWRSVLFDSSRSLELKLFCTYGSPVTEILNSSLDFPVTARFGGFPESNCLSPDDEDGVIALLHQPARLFEVQLTATAPIMGEMATIGLTQQPFSVLEYLRLSTRTGSELILPCGFGGTPSLRTLWMVRVALPSLPRLLSLAQNLVSFQLEEIPSIGYTMEALLICLPALTRLKTLRIHFLLPSYRPVLSIQSLERRFILHSLNNIDFHGTSEYLECLLATIDTPFLKSLHITFLNQLTFRIPQLSQFIRRTETQQSPNQATIYYFGADISVILSQAGMPDHLALRILCEPLDWQISSMAEIFETLSPTLSQVEQLNIGASSAFRSGQDEIVTTQLDFPFLFRQFGNAKRLYLTGESVLHVTVALGQITGQLAVTVLPELREIYVGNHAELASAQGGVAPFIAVRDHFARPVFIRSLRAEPSQNFKSRLDIIPSARTYPSPTQIDLPILSPQLDIQGTREWLNSTNPRLLAILQMAGFSQYHLYIHLRQESEANLLQRFAFPTAFGSQFPGQVAQINSIPAMVLRNGMFAMYERLGMEWRWETFTRMWARSFTTATYQNTLSSLQSFVVAGLTTPLYTFEPLGQSLRIPLEYSSYLIERGQLELAIETIEQGKELILSEMSELHSSTGRLRAVNPGLADRLARVNQAMKEFNPPISADHGGADAAIAVAFEELYTLLLDHQEVIQQIRALHGFADFMKAVPFRTLQTAASRGPIIIVNHCRLRCDILIVLHDSPPSLIPTNEGFYERASNLARQLKEATYRHGLDSEDYDHILANVLAELYELVGLPVVNRLRELGIPKQSRIWWYPTSVFWSLPLHTMGPVRSNRDIYFSDMYVCSYTLTLGTLIQSRKSHAPNSDSQHSLLLVAQPDPYLPIGRGEIQVFRSLNIPVTTLLSSEATQATVIEALQNHTLVHFACPSRNYSGELLDTAIALYRDSLTLRDILNLQLLPAEFAFLSFCSSAQPSETGDPTTEGLNIAAAMQYRGCGSVVGVTGWLLDKDGRDMAHYFYKGLVKNSSRSLGVPLGERSAKALQSAVKKLRGKRDMTLERWVSWVHYGA